MQDHRISINRGCPCQQVECPIRGNCVLCVQNHPVHKGHIPECFQNILRPIVQAFAQQVELVTNDIRHPNSFWDTFDKDGFLKNCIEQNLKENQEPNKVVGGDME